MSPTRTGRAGCWPGSIGLPRSRAALAEFARAVSSRWNCDAWECARSSSRSTTRPLRRGAAGTPAARAARPGSNIRRIPIAQTNVLLLRPQGGRAQVGYRADAGSWDTDVRTPTRLSNDSMRIRLGKLIAGNVRPWADAEPPWRAWALSEVAIRVGRVAAEDVSDPLMAAASGPPNAWPIAERAVPLIALQEERRVGGVGAQSEAKPVRVRYIALPVSF